MLKKQAVRMPVRCRLQTRAEGAASGSGSTAFLGLQVGDRKGSKRPHTHEDPTPHGSWNPVPWNPLRLGLRARM